MQMKSQVLPLWLVGTALLGTFAVPALHGQQLSGFIDPRSSTQLNAECGDPPTAFTDCPISISITPQPMTNAHLHNTPPQPSSTMCTGQCTSAAATITGHTDAKTGLFAFTLLAGIVGQDEVLTVSSPNTLNTSAYAYSVGYGDLKYGSYASWKPIGGSDTGADTGHGTTANNRYMTLQTYNALYATYVDWATLSGNCYICVNDAALPYGGKFDIQAVVPDSSGSYHPWASPHISHDRGSAVDIGATRTKYCQYPVAVNAFLAACKRHGFDPVHSIPEGNHVHCNTLDPATYPTQ